MDDIVLQLRNDASIIIEMGQPVENMNFCDLVYVKYPEKNGFLLADDSFFSILENIVGLIKSALQGRLQKHCSINRDIGFLWNQALRDDSSLEYNDLGWVGRRNILFGSPGYARPSVTTWLYNDGNNIFLEITPNYPFNFRDPGEGEVYISFEEFMKNYKPLVIEQIPNEVAEQWVKQCSDALEIVYPEGREYN